MVSGAKEVNKVMFPHENTAYIFNLLHNAQAFLRKRVRISPWTMRYTAWKKLFFKRIKTIRLAILFPHTNVVLLSNAKEKMRITYKEYQGILTYNIGNVSIIGNDF